MTEEQIYAAKLEAQAKGDDGFSKSDAQKARIAEEQERKIYGRFWIWESYFSEKNTQKWLDCAEKLKHVNDHVIEDIEDWILLQGFKGLKQSKIEQIINDDHKERIAVAKKLMTKDGELYEEKAFNDIKKRRFLNHMRPPNCWNFFEDCPEDDKVKHVLRFDAKPQECYIDKRVDKILELIEEIGHSLQKYEDTKWNTLRKRTLDIFIDEYKQLRK